MWSSLYSHTHVHTIIHPCMTAASPGWLPAPTSSRHEPAGRIHHSRIDRSVMPATEEWNFSVLHARMNIMRCMKVRHLFVPGALPPFTTGNSGCDGYCIRRFMASVFMMRRASILLCMSSAYCNRLQRLPLYL